MKNIAGAIAEYRNELQIAADGGALGGDAESKLLQNLQKVIERNRKVYYLVIGLLVAAFVLAVVFVWVWRAEPTVLAGIFAATGISVPWAVNSIINLWKEISNAETLCVLIADLDDKKVVKEIVKLLAEKLYK